MSCYKGYMETQKIDIHRLTLRYHHLRVQQPSRVRRLANSIAHNGQLSPLVVVEDTDCLVLIDGYQRLAALQSLERDTALVVITDLTEQQALIHLLVQRGERPWQAIEEAGLIQELRRRFGCSFGEIGTMIGRDKSFVKRRFDLLESLPEEILHLVLAGNISTWAASRVLVPLARANDADAARLAAHLEKEPLSTRQLQSFHEHYLTVNRQVRDRMLEAPSVFLKSLEAMNDAQDSSPEGKWLRDIKAVCGILLRLQKNPTMVFYPNQEQQQRNTLLVHVSKARRLTEELQQQIEEHIRDDQTNHGRVDQGTGQTGCQPAGNSQEAEHLKEHGPQGAEQRDDQTDPEQGIDVYTTPAPDQESFPGVPGQCGPGPGGACCPP